MTNLLKNHPASDRSLVSPKATKINSTKSCLQRFIPKVTKAGVRCASDNCLQTKWQKIYVNTVTQIIAQICIYKLFKIVYIYTKQMNKEQTEKVLKSYLFSTNIMNICIYSCNCFRFKYVDQVISILKYFKHQNILYSYTAHLSVFQMVLKRQDIMKTHKKNLIILIMQQRIGS